MTAPPWGHKPPPAEPFDAYWMDPPPARSERCDYWMRRLADGSWHPNKYIAREGYYSAAAILGVYLWEYLNVLGPAMSEERAARVS